MKEKNFDKFKDQAIEGRQCVHSIEVPSTNSPFSSYQQSTEILRDMGYTIASMCGTSPIGFAKNYSYIAKWYNLSNEDRKLLDGIIIPLSDFRTGSCSIVFFNEPDY